MILICYDGSEDAKAAIQHGGELFSGQSATVLTVWQPVASMGAHAPSAFMFLPSLLDADEIDQANADHAAEQAAQGADLAREAGFDAAPTSCAQAGTTADTIFSQAQALDTSAILMGSRGLAGLRSLLLGSVSHAVLQHADRPVIVVPSPEVAASRKRSRSALANKHELTDGG